MSSVPTRKLKPQARVAVLAPSGPFDPPIFERGLEVLKQRYTPVLGEHLRSSKRYLAGTTVDRVADFAKALQDESIDAIWAARGGFGAIHLLPEIRFLAEKKSVIGFSDITALHLMRQCQGLRSLHAPVVTQLGTQPAEVTDRLFDILEGALPSPLMGTDSVCPGIAEGPLVGGNLSVIASLCGTPFQPDFRGAVLLLEDIGERPYRIDRMLSQLKLAGILESVSGIVLGEFTNCEEKDAGYTSAEVLSEILRATGKPCARGFNVGHGKINHAAVLGARVHLNAELAELAWSEPLCA